MNYRRIARYCDIATAIGIWAVALMSMHWAGWL